MHFHRWTKWEPETWEGIERPMGAIFPRDVRGKDFMVTKTYQVRRCETCGKYQFDPPECGITIDGGDTCGPRCASESSRIRGC